MRQIQFDLKIEFGSYRQSISQVFDLLEKYNKSINAHLLQINAEQLTDVARNAAEKALMSAKFKVKGLTREIVDGFTVKVDKKKDERRIKVSHLYYKKAQEDIIRKTKNRKHKFPRKWLYKTIDEGRRSFEIVSKDNKSKSSSPLVFFWKKKSKWVVFHWKGPRGGRKRFLKVNNKAGPVDYSTGARFTEAAFKAVESVINNRIAKMQASASV